MDLELTEINHKNVLSLQFLLCFGVISFLGILLCRLCFSECWALYNRVDRYIRSLPFVVMHCLGVK